MKSKEPNIKWHTATGLGLAILITVVSYILDITTHIHVARIVTVAGFIVTCLVSIAVICISHKNSSQIEKIHKEADNRLDFISNLSHEIRTPLNGIIGLNHITIQNFEDKDLVYNNILKIDKAARYLMSLLNAVLDYSKLSSNKMQYNITDVLVESAIDNTCAMQWGTFLDKGITLNVKLDLGTKCIRTDEAKLKQVLVSLLSNAVKYTPSGGTVTVSAIQMKSDDKTVTTMIEVTDTGIGISEEKQKSLFAETDIEDKINDHRKGGIGLSLTIGKKIMKGLGGDLIVKSEEGQGSTFTIYLPSDISDKEPKDLIEKELRGVDLAAKQDLNILAAEDNELNAEVLTEILTAAGYHVTLARDGVEVLQTFIDSAEGEYDLILMDIRMPNMNGYEACRNIRDLDRRDAKDIPIYACTANTFSEDRAMALKSGMNDFITKPIDVAKLLIKLQEINS